MNGELLKIISASLNNNADEIVSISNIDINNLIALAKKHGICSVLYCGAELLGIDNNLSDKLRASYYSEIRNDILQKTELQRIQSAFESNGIYNIALKGLSWLFYDFPTNENGCLKYIKDEDWFQFIQTKPYRKK